MGASRQPGYSCLTRRILDVEDGTSCRAEMFPPRHSCLLENPIGVDRTEHHDILSRQLIDMKWQSAEAKAIFSELDAKKQVKEFAEDKGKNLEKAAFQAGVKRVSGVEVGPELSELKDLSSELLGLAKKGARVSNIHGKLALRISNFLEVSELKGKANRRAFRKLTRDLKGFGTKHLKSFAKDFGKGLVTDIFLKWAHDFILKTGEEQLALAQTPNEIKAAQFLVFDAITLEAGDKMGDIRFWNADSFWRRVFSDFSHDYQEGKLKSLSAIWEAWSQAVTKDISSKNQEVPYKTDDLISIQVLDRRILESKSFPAHLP